MVVPPPTAVRTDGPGRGTTTTRRRAGAGERADAANPIPGSPWGTVASLTLEQLMEVVGAVYEEMCRI